MITRLIDYDTERVVLQKEHLKDNTIKRLDKGSISVYDIEKSDVHSEYIYAYKTRAKKLGFPVLLIINGITRLLIFDKKIYDKNQIHNIRCK
jgi:hypothetical protein